MQKQKNIQKYLNTPTVNEKNQEIMKLKTKNKTRGQQDDSADEYTHLASLKTSTECSEPCEYKRYDK